MTDELVIGLLSGTSRDGVDAVLVNFTPRSMDLLHAQCTPYPAAIKKTLDQLLESHRPPTEDMARLLDETLGRFFARVAQDLAREAGMEMRDISAIGSHGQSVWHAPMGDEPVSIQLGNGQLMAKNTGITVVTDFRSADLAADGQGAPLAPLLHQELFYKEGEDRAIVNIGGIANLTLLPASASVTGFDSGPGNCLMDAWTMRHLQKSHDEAGGWAAKGDVDAQLLETMLQDPYFTQTPPKSTGPEHFNMGWLERVLAGDEPDATDVQATLAELTALTIARSLPVKPLPKRLLVCGGGAHNTFLLSRIAAALPEVVVDTTARYGADPDWVEGLLFAWLARERLAGKALDTSMITGATHPVLLGAIFEP